jgi:hypothetical protein
MVWDPTNSLPTGRRLLWVALAAVVCALQGPEFVRDMRPPLDRGLDFFQDWASARNRTEGLPAYTPHEETAERYLGVRVDPGDPFFVPVNAHPPTSVLLALPLARLSYSDAFLVWALFSLAAFGGSVWLVGRELGIRCSAWSLLPAATLLLVCYPFRLHVQQGQLAIVLLACVTGAWVAYRRGRQGLAGALLAAATAVKLFPGFLFLFFLLRGRWRVLVGGAISFVVLAILTATALGPDVYAAYFREVLPGVGDFRSGWGNVSLTGVWFKLFDPITDRMRVEPLLRSPLLARAGALICCGAVAAGLAWLTLRVRSREAENRAFGLGVIVMLLVSPLTWEHYLPLLLIPLALAWVDLPPEGVTRRHLAFVVLVVVLWADSNQVCEPFLPGSYLKSVAAPVHTVTVLSLKCYALLGFIALVASSPLLIAELRGPREALFRTPRPAYAAAPGAATAKGGRRARVTGVGCP